MLKGQLIKKVIEKLQYWHLLDRLSDETYLKIMYWKNLNKKLDLRNPKSFNEKLQWLKLYDRKPEYTTMVDKYAVKQYVAEKIGDQYIIPNLGVWDSFDEIDFNMLPNQFVLKCTHDSGGVVICKDKSTLDIEAAKSKIERSLKNNYSMRSREWPYKNVKPRIIAEAYMEDDQTEELRDYKLYCFAGKVKMLLIVTERGKGSTKGDYFDRDGKHLDLTWGFPHANVEPKIPECFDKMIQLAELLASDIKDVRVDFYYINGKIYFGEITFFDGSGFQKIEPYEWDLRLGSWISKI